MASRRVGFLDLMKYFLTTIAIAFIIISCSHGKTIHFPEGKDLNNPVEVTIIRNRNLTCGAQSTAILLDEVPIAYIRTGEYVSFFVESGVHYLRVRGNGVYGNFEKEKKYYFLISINFFDMIDNYYTGDSCGFEIEKISEEEGLKRIKKSKNLIEKEEAPKSVAKVAPTEGESKKKKEAPKSVSKVAPTEGDSKKIAYSFNPEEPWTGTWEIKFYSGDDYIFVLKQDGKEVKSTENSYGKLTGTVEGYYLDGWIELGNRRSLRLKMSLDNLSFSGNFKYYGPAVYSKIWGNRRE